MAALWNFLKVLRANGGVFKSMYALWLRDDLKIGTLVGEDKFGNKYYENDKYFFGRNRWVHYADHVSWNYDASQVAPEWSGWLHYRTDLPPHQDPNRPHYPWVLDMEENMTGTSEQYVPWSTTRPKIHAWRPPKASMFGDRCPKQSKPTGCAPKTTDFADVCPKPKVSENSCP